MAANRGTSSKPARFFRHRRRFADFPDAPPHKKTNCALGGGTELRSSLFMRSLWPLCIRVTVGVWGLRLGDANGNGRLLRRLALGARFRLGGGHVGHH